MNTAHTDEPLPIPEFLRNQDNLADEVAKANMKLAQQPLSDTYVQTVPDKCDRIVWRGSYYHLPLKDGAGDQTFQARVQPWMMACFGAEISADGIERNHRFLEEALELVQSLDCTQSEAHQLVDYVFGRPIGEPRQEVGGVMVTLAALCLAHHMDMHEDGEVELARIWTKVEQIRAKQAAKPRHSPLPA